MCVHSFEAIGAVVPEISCSQTNWNTDSWSSKLWKPILANRDGICKIGDIHVDHMTIEILCADLCDIWAKFVGVTERNVFCKNRPHGGAIPGLSRKCGSEVHCWHPRSVCAQFHSNRTSGPGDYAFTDGLTHTHTDGRTHTRTDTHTDTVQNIVSPHAFGLVETIILSGV